MWHLWRVGTTAMASPGGPAAYGSTEERFDDVAATEQLHSRLRNPRHRRLAPHVALMAGCALAAAAALASRRTLLSTGVRHGSPEQLTSASHMAQALVTTSAERDAAAAAAEAASVTLQSSYDVHRAAASGERTARLLARRRAAGIPEIEVFEAGGSESVVQGTGGRYQTGGGVEAACTHHWMTRRGGCAGSSPPPCKTSTTSLSHSHTPALSHSHALTLSRSHAITAPGHTST